MRAEEIKHSLLIEMEKAAKAVLSSKSELVRISGIVENINSQRKTMLEELNSDKEKEVGIQQHDTYL